MNSTQVVLSDVLNRRQAAQYIGVAIQTLDKLDLPRIKICRRVIFRKSSLDKWLSEHETSKGVQS